MNLADLGIWSARNGRAVAVVYSIRDWNEHFEVSQSRKVDGPMTWVALPTKHDGKGFRRIMAMDDGAAVYGAWCLLVAVAAKCPRRGTLEDKDGPLDADDLALKTGCPHGMFDRALNVLSSNKIGWLLVSEWVRSGSELPLQDSTEQDSTRQEDCGEPDKPDSPPNYVVLIFPCVGSGAKEWFLTEAKLAQYRDSFPGVDVLRECRTARQWCLDNPTRRKTFNGMAGFLSRWLTKAQNAQGTSGESIVSNGAAQRAERAKAAHRESESRKVILEGRTAGKTDEEITSDLAAKGLDWTA